MCRRGVLLAAVTSFFAAGVAAAPAIGAPWEVSLDTRIGVPRGYVKVRENEIQGTRLELHRDLGIDVSEVVAAGAAYHLDSRSAVRASFETVFLYGSATLPRDVFFNGATLAGGTTVRSRPEFFRMNIDYERDLVALARGGVLGASAGLTYVLLTYKVHGTLAATTRDRETKEDFVTQELPVPLLGLSARQPLGPRLRFVGAVRGGLLPRVDSLRSEGGDVKLTQSHCDVDLGVEYALGPLLSLAGGYHYTYFFQHEVSREDGNEFLLSDNSFRLALGYRF